MPSYPYLRGAPPHSRAAAAMVPIIRRLGLTQRDRDLLLELTRSYRSRIVIPRLKAGRIELQLQEILEVCQDPSAAERIRRAIRRADQLRANLGPGCDAD